MHCHRNSCHRNSRSWLLRVAAGCCGWKVSSRRKGLRQAPPRPRNQHSFVPVGQHGLKAERLSAWAAPQMLPRLSAVAAAQDFVSRPIRTLAGHWGRASPRLATPPFHVRTKRVPFPRRRSRPKGSLWRAFRTSDFPIAISQAWSRASAPVQGQDWAGSSMRKTGLGATYVT